jgi:hypothetical protein
MGGGKGGSKAPPPIDPGKSMGEYLFGKDFSSQYQGITDPRLQDRLINAESIYRPQYTALELADINTMAYGTQGGTESLQYKRLEAELAGLKAGQEISSGTVAERTAELRKQAEIIFPGSGESDEGLGGSIGFRSSNRGKGVDPVIAQREAFVNASLGTGVEDRAARIGQIETELSRLETAPGQAGLFDMLEDQSSRAGALQREQLQLQREADVGALQEFAPQVVEAYRAADPYSAGLADLSQQQAETLYAEGEGELSPERRRMAEQAARMGSLARGRIGDESSVAAELLGREQVRSGLRAEARQAGGQAFGMQRQLAGDVGMTLLGRPSAAIGLGGSMLGQAQQGAAGPMGPQLFDPNVGINMALQQRGQDVTFQGMQAQAKAAGQAGIMGGIGGIAQGIGAAGGIAAFCWVAREVYGIESGKWMQFREWMLNDSPSWFRKLYLKYGERFAKFISNKPRIKSIIRNWMNTKIK